MIESYLKLESVCPRWRLYYISSYCRMSILRGTARMNHDICLICSYMFKHSHTNNIKGRFASSHLQQRLNVECCFSCTLWSFSAWRMLENPRTEWRFLAEKITDFYGPMVHFPARHGADDTGGYAIGFQLPLPPRSLRPVTNLTPQEFVT